MPLLSIIIPTFNSEKVIRRCLEKLGNQNFKDFEVLIIDGYSADSTMSIVKEYVLEHSFVTWISEPDRGIYDAMNKGICLAKGEWIYFLGSDDSLFDDNTLQEIFERNLEHYKVVYGDVVSTRFDGPYDGVFTAEKIYHKNICHQAVFFKKEIFEIVGNFNLKYRSHADWEHNMRWIMHPGIQKHYVNQIIAEYADGGFSSMNEDQAFAADKDRVYLRLARNNISADLRSRIFLSLSNQNRMAGRKITSFIYRFQYWILRAWQKFL